MKNNFLKLIELIEHWHVDIAYDYADYQKIAFAIANEFGEEGRKYYHRICRQSVKYNEQDADYRYSNALRTGRGDVHLGTVFAIAKAAGVKLSKDGGHTTKHHKVEDEPSCQDKDEKINNKPQSASIFDIKNYLDRECFRLNEITGMVEYKAPDEKEWRWLNDRTENSLWCHFLEKGFKCNIKMFHDTINSDFSVVYNPFKAYFQGLPKWTHDKPDYIKELADTIKLVGETPKLRIFFVKVFKKWLVAMVAGTLLDNFANEYILTLLGKQGLFKTSFFAELLPKELRDHFCSKELKYRTDKDDDIAYVNNMLICIDDIDHITTANMVYLKEVSSKRTFQIRLPYERHAQNMVHHNSFCATGNNTRILNDPTGTRRFLTFNVESIVSPFEHPFNYEGIYSQAYALMKEGEANYIFTNEDNAEINESNSDFDEICMEAELINKYFALPVKGEKGTPMSATEIKAKINLDVRDMLSVKKVGEQLVKLGFESKMIHGCRKYYVHVRNADELKLIEAEEATMFEGSPKEPEQQDLPF